MASSEENQNENKKSLSEVVSEIEEKCDREFWKILVLAYKKRRGKVSSEIPYQIDPKFIDLVVDRLAFSIFDLNDKLSSKGKRKKAPIPIEPVYEMLSIAEPEIDRLYSKIKKIGFSGSIMDADSKWEAAALGYFDNNGDTFEAIKREYLQDKDLYAFRGGHESADFKGRLFKKILDDLFKDYPMTIGARPVLKGYKQMKKKR